MCLMAFAYKQHPQYPLIVISNRDEFYARPSQSAHCWEDEPSIYAGRDLQSKGTWLGVSKNGRFAAVTNFRDPSRPDIGEKSRGTLVHHFLTAESTAQFIEMLKKSKDQYGGYNFIGYDGETMMHYNNIYDEGGEIEPGVHSISNATLNTPWPKTIFAAEQLSKNLSNCSVHQLKTLLENRTIAKDSRLPSTGVGIHLERILSAPFVQMNGYGTRSSATVLFHHHESITFVERLYENGEYVSETIQTIQIEQ